jgi:hypothetical protein
VDDVDSVAGHTMRGQGGAGSVDEAIDDECVEPGGDESESASGRFHVTGKVGHRVAYSLRECLQNNLC